MTYVFGEIKVGPTGHGDYAYSVSGKLSERRYHNPASARFDSKRLQHLTEDGTVEPWDSRPEYTSWVPDSDETHELTREEL
jgi:hypothetical protein